MALRIRFESRVLAADVVETVLRFARTRADNFTVGPFNEADLMADGLQLTGDVAGVEEHLHKKFPALKIEDSDG